MPGWEKLHASLEAIPRELGVTPKAVLCISAHWEEDQFTVQTSPNPPMLYDYGGFPDYTYRIQYPAPGSPEVAARVVELEEPAFHFRGGVLEDRTQVLRLPGAAGAEEEDLAVDLFGVEVGERHRPECPLFGDLNIFDGSDRKSVV